MGQPAKEEGKFEKNSIAGEGGVDLFRPGIDPALEVEQFFIALLLKKKKSLGATDSRFALQDNFLILGNLLPSLWNFAQGNKSRARNFGNLIFVGFAHVDQDKRLLGIDLLFELGAGDFRNLGSFLDGAFAGGGTTKLLIINQAGDGFIGTTDRAVRIFA